MKKTLLLMATVIALAMSTMAGAFAAGHAEIISPASGDVVYEETLYLEAMSGVETSVNVAVRATTEGDNDCTPGTDNVLYRDISGDLSTDAEGVYTGEVDISAASPGLYCFAFDPADADRISVKFYIADGRVSGGGQILEEDYKVSFGGGAYAIEGVEGKDIDGVGSWTVRFHEVSVEGVSKTTFSGDHVYDMNFFPGGAIANFKVDGIWDGNPGDTYTLIVRAEDQGQGQPGGDDNIRFQLLGVYDTYGSGDFPGESDEFGGLRTNVDRGNLQIDTR